MNLIVICVLLVATAFLSAYEIAFFSLSPSHLQEISKSKKSADKQLEVLKRQPEKTLATLLISNSTLNIAIVILLSICISSLFDFSQSPWVSFLIQTIIITFILLLFCEIIPKVYARQDPLKITRRLSGIISLLTTLLSPFSSILLASGKVVSKKMTAFSTKKLSMTDLSNALKLTTSTQKEDDKEILEGIIRFGSKSANEVKTARPDIAAINIHSNFYEVKKQVIDLGYSRIPVYYNNIDNIRGILYSKDLLSHLEKNDNFKWQILLRPAYFVPETKMIDDLLREFQTNKNHIAIVVDEFGGTSGIVTLEDILEEVVGEIDDEYDDQTPLFSRIDEQTFDFDGKILLPDFFKITGIETAPFDEITSGVESLAGLILELKGDIPKLHEKIAFHSYSFEILEVTKRRILKVRLITADPSSIAKNE
ncbi:gliding motility-associated protein GldE [Microbacter margulisiae]|uniref:Gliding motility-associated protein GldE n=1 Tax=Microbacter margulisiae TaxID=1350067 RepID=A0A7W5DRI3_9PORP|nr:gliding motility-associated protein GldE [Microbacter margulisiae]MBB3186898.1 gliding motility-associated protein GldE [Microbacter margulisiae]